MPIRLLTVSNMSSHHQIPLADAFFARLGSGFHFAVMGPVSEARKSLGWRDPSQEAPYMIHVWKSAEEKRRFRECVEHCDVVLRGHASMVPFMRRILSGKLTFRCQERIFKPAVWHPRRLIAFLRWYPLERICNVANYHGFTTGAYAGHDLVKVGLSRGRVWRFGYFTASAAGAPNKPSPDPVRILYAGRLLRLKRVSMLVDAARRLREMGCQRFQVEIVGEGEQSHVLKRMAADHGLEGFVRLSPPLSPEAVREKMVAAHVFVLPSSYAEGWGAVINEAMDSGCCVVSSTGPGAAPWLIEHGKTGFLFRSGNIQGLTDLLAGLIRSPGICRTVGERARQYVRTTWSPEVVADRVIALSEGLLGIADMPNYGDGPCSCDPLLRPQDVAEDLAGLEVVAPSVHELPITRQSEEPYRANRHRLQSTR